MEFQVELDEELDCNMGRDRGFSLATKSFRYSLVPRKQNKNVMLKWRETPVMARDWGLEEDAECFELDKQAIIASKSLSVHYWEYRRVSKLKI